jgi:hypothetical protein
MASFAPKDDIIYDELWDVLPGAVVKGDAAVVQDVFGFYFFDRETAGDEVTFIYRMRQVIATKKTGTGEDIVAGEKVYYYVATKNVSPNKVGSAGSDYYFCGWAKKSASAADTTVLINFDGTRHTENI